MQRSGEGGGWRQHPCWLVCQRQNSVPSGSTFALYVRLLNTKTHPNRPHRNGQIPTRKRCTEACLMPFDKRSWACFFHHLSLRHREQLIISRKTFFDTSLPCQQTLTLVTRSTDCQTRCWKRQSCKNPERHDYRRALIFMSPFSSTTHCPVTLSPGWNTVLLASKTMSKHFNFPIA